MANIVDYLAWRGDLTWSRSPFNDVDNLLLCTLTYTDFEKVIAAIKAVRMSRSELNVPNSVKAKLYFEKPVRVYKRLKYKNDFLAKM